MNKIDNASEKHIRRLNKKNNKQYFKLNNITWMSKLIRKNLQKLRLGNSNFWSGNFRLKIIKIGKKSMSICSW